MSLWVFRRTETPPDVRAVAPSLPLVLVSGACGIVEAWGGHGEDRLA